MFSKHSKMARETKTIEAMINIYCRENHESSPGLCLECSSLLDYAIERRNRCPFKENKPTCAKCIVHCYTLEMRGKITDMMRYAGPLMLQRHPILAMFHLVKGLRKEPQRLKRRVRNPKDVE